MSGWQRGLEASQARTTMCWEPGEIRAAPTGEESKPQSPRGHVPRCHCSSEIDSGRTSSRGRTKLRVDGISRTQVARQAPSLGLTPDGSGWAQAHLEGPGVRKTRGKERWRGKDRARGRGPSQCLALPQEDGAMPALALGDGTGELSPPCTQSSSRLGRWPQPPGL